MPLPLDPSSFDVVTGGAGFIGSHLVDGLVAQGRHVVVLDSFVTGGPRNLEQHADDGRVRLVEGDVTDADAVDAVLTGAERVFHLAALADIVPSIEQPDAYFRANVDGTYTVVEAARRHGVRRLVYAASSSCYGIPDHYPTPESAPLRPQYPYALTKSLGEQIVLHWAQVYGLPAVSLRFFNVYGPRARTAGTYGAVFGVFLAQLLAGEPLTVVGDGEQTRDFTYVGDVVSAVLQAAASDVSGRAFNVGSNQAVSVNRLVELLGAERTVHIPKRPGEPDCTLADTTAIGDALGWTPSVPIDVGVQTMLEHIEYWREAPVWTPESIEHATAAWFTSLGSDRSA